MANYDAKGRPALSASEKLAETIQCRMTAEERAACEKAAERAGVNLSTWLRERILRIAKRELKN